MIAVRAMTPADLPLGMRLKAQAGWNQTETDWRRFLSLAPDGCFVAELDGRPVGTAATTRFGLVAWLCMVLVDAEARRRGVGTALVERSLRHLDDGGVRTVRLDATPLGRPVYERLGFRCDFDLDRWAGRGGSGPCAQGVRPGADADLPAIVRCDAAAAGCDRTSLLQRLWDDHPGGMWISDDRTGYAAARPGALAMQIGPVVADAIKTGLALLESAVAAAGTGAIFVDIPRNQPAAVAWARDHGLAVQRTLTRMSRGEPTADSPGLLWASSGPENG